MANEPVANEPTHCPDCGAAFALVGRGTHARMCRGAPVGSRENPVLVLPVKAAKKIRAASPQTKVAGAEVGPAATYRYRDPEKRREYMKAYMQKRRGRANADG